MLFWLHNIQPYLPDYSKHFETKIIPEIEVSEMQKWSFTMALVSVSAAE